MTQNKVPMCIYVTLLVGQVVGILKFIGYY